MLKEPSPRVCQTINVSLEIVVPEIMRLFDSQIETGDVTLTLSAAAISPCEIAATDDMTLFIQANPVADAG